MSALLAGTQGGKVEASASWFFPGVSFVLAVNQIKAAFRGRGSVGQSGGQGPERSADFLIFLEYYGRAMVNRGRDGLK